MTDGREEPPVNRARRGGAGALGRLCQLHLDRTDVTFCPRVGSTNEAEDATEYAFVKGWKAIGLYESGRLPSAARLYRLAHRAAIDRDRARRPTTSIDETVDLEDERPIALGSAAALFDREERAAGLDDG